MQLRFPKCFMTLIQPYLNSSKFARIFQINEISSDEQNLIQICLLHIVLCSEVDIEAQFSINQSRADEITMREDYGNLPMTIHDDGFGDIGFDADGPDFIRDDANIDVRTETTLHNDVRNADVQLTGF